MNGLKRISPFSGWRVFAGFVHYTEFDCVSGNAAHNEVSIFKAERNDEAFQETHEKPPIHWGLDRINVAAKWPE